MVSRYAKPAGAARSPGQPPTAAVEPAPAAAPAAEPPAPEPSRTVTALTLVRLAVVLLGFWRLPTYMMLAVPELVLLMSLPADAAYQSALAWFVLGASVMAQAEPVLVTMLLLYVVGLAYRDTQWTVPAGLDAARIQALRGMFLKPAERNQAEDAAGKDAAAEVPPAAAASEPPPSLPAETASEEASLS